MKWIKHIGIAAALVTTSLSKETPPLESEPEYVATPRYLPLIFGEGEGDRVWLVLDGDQLLYVDRDMDGRINPENEKFPAGKHPQFGEDHFVIPEITNPKGETVANNLEVTRYGTGKKEDIVKVILPDSLPQMQGWRLLFVEDWEKAKPIRFSSLVRPGYLRSKKVSLSDEQAEIHLCLYAHRLKGEFAGLVGIGAYPEDASLVATIHWPADTPPNDPVTTQVHLTKRC
ncbi:MAG: hypothetical protein HRU46_13585 [Verrucomicrobiales bacterium]|nr:hypothetical protein [Verrucomicrobiales bacterium]